ncbi:MAG: hypothetical protein JWM10_5399, partial [Myxococcaceae bacterium]|nr:hypothetical protein [Myxococcaceae bacterium]
MRVEGSPDANAIGPARRRGLYGRASPMPPTSARSRRLCLAALLCSAWGCGTEQVVDPPRDASTPDVPAVDAPAIDRPADVPAIDRPADVPAIDRPA